jgi:ATP sulfurylase
MLNEYHCAICNEILLDSSTIFCSRECEEKFHFSIDELKEVLIVTIRLKQVMIHKHLYETAALFQAVEKELQKQISRRDADELLNKITKDTDEHPPL